MTKETEKRTSRASQTRVKEERKKVWTPPSSLDAPPAPDGFKHRCIRAESMGFDDTSNMSAKLRSVKSSYLIGRRHPFQICPVCHHHVI